MNVKTVLKASIAASALWAAGSVAMAQEKTQIEVIHAFTGESAAPGLRFLIKEFEARCNCRWQDNAIAGGAKARQTMANRAIGGDPAPVNQVHSPLVFKELTDAGLMVSVAPDGWEAIKEHVPAPIWEQMLSADGKGLRWTPNTMGLHNLGMFNKKALDTVGMQPPKTVDEVFAFLDAVKEKTDMVPLAWAEVPIQMFQSMQNTVAAVAEADVYNRIYADLDASALDTPEFRKAAETFRKFKAYTDEGRVGRVHQDAANMVVQNRAAMQYLGTHVLNVYITAGAVAGKDYECTSLGNVALLGPNGFMYGKPSSDAVAKGEADFASMIMEADIQAKFAEIMGGLPIRLDADKSKLSKCIIDAAEPTADAARTVLDPSLTMPQDKIGAMTDAIVSYWSTDSQSVDEFIAKTKSALAG
jgi:glucose/mannose transport system substrate-binding protein